MSFERSAGIVLHPTSLPGKYGIGELGKEAKQWIDVLEAAGQTLWQVMPLGPTGYGDSPYQSFSAFAGNPYLISIDNLIEQEFLRKTDLENMPDFLASSVDFGPVIAWKLQILSLAYERFGLVADAASFSSFDAFCQREAYWLDDYALFMACKEANDGKQWTAWDVELRTRNPETLTEWQNRLEEPILKQKFWQWLFYSQWQDLHDYAASKGVSIIGDIPIFVSMDSADTWANPELFFLDEQGEPTVVAGVPPDYFSETGQRWGNPLYRWDVLEKTGYAWWEKRIRAVLNQVDIVRIDHFRGFEAYWEIPASEETAVKGTWVKGGGQPFFDAMRDAFGDELAIIAEDLGVITPEVEALRDDNNLPGMQILQFAFSTDADNLYLPHNYPRNSVVYTGTHDNDTTAGWYATATIKEQDLARRYLGRDGSNIAWDMIRLAYASPAVLALTTLQDILNLGSEARFNTPGVAAGNWSWRFSFDDIEPWMVETLKDISLVYGRVEAELDETDEELKTSESS